MSVKMPNHESPVFTEVKAGCVNSVKTNYDTMAGIAVS